MPHSIYVTVSLLGSLLCLRCAYSLGRAKGWREARSLIVPRLTSMRENIRASLSGDKS